MSGPNSAGTGAEPDYADLDEDQDMTCPISYELMHDPVRVTASGRVMDRGAVQVHFMRQLHHEQDMSCPMTRITVASMDDLQPLPKLQAYIRQHCVNTGQPPPKPYLGPLPLLCEFLDSEGFDVRAESGDRLMRHIQRGMAFTDAELLWKTLGTVSLDTHTDAARVWALGAALNPTYLLLGTTGRTKEEEGEDTVASNAQQLMRMGQLLGIVQLLSCDSTELQALAAEALALLAPAHGARLAAAGVPAALVQLLRTSDNESVQHAAAKAVSQMMWKERGVIQQAVAAELRQHLGSVSISGDAHQQLPVLRLINSLLLQGKAALVPVAVMAVDFDVMPRLMAILQSNQNTDALQQALSLVSVMASSPQLQVELVQAGVLLQCTRMARCGLNQEALTALKALVTPTASAQVLQSVVAQVSSFALLEGLAAVLPDHLVRRGCVPELARLLRLGPGKLRAAVAAAVPNLSAAHRDAVVRSGLLDTLIKLARSDTGPQAYTQALCKLCWGGHSGLKQATQSALRTAVAGMTATDTSVQLPAMHLTARVLAVATSTAPLETVVTDLAVVPQLMAVLRHPQEAAVHLHALEVVQMLAKSETLQPILLARGVLPALPTAASDVVKHLAAQQALQGINMEPLLTGSSREQLAVIQQLHSLVRDLSQGATPPTLVIPVDIGSLLVSLIGCSHHRVVVEEAMSLVAALARGFQVQHALVRVGLPDALHTVIQCSQVLRTRACTVVSAFPDTLQHVIAARFTQQPTQGEHVPQLLGRLIKRDSSKEAETAAAIRRLAFSHPACLRDIEVITALLGVLQDGQSQGRPSLAVAVCTLCWRKGGDPPHQSVLTPLKTTMAGLQGPSPYHQLAAVRVLSQLLAHGREIVSAHQIMTDLDVLPGLASIVQHSQEGALLLETVQAVASLAQQVKSLVVQDQLGPGLVALQQRSSSNPSLAPAVAKALQAVYPAAPLPV